MDGSSEKMLDALARAIEAENYGRHFYLMASASVADPRAKEAFAKLASDELAHFEFLKRQHASFSEKGVPDGSARLSPAAGAAAKGSFFSDRFKDRIKGAHFEIAALSVGMELELSAVRFYEAQATAAALPEVRKFFAELALWESGHYEALSAALEETRGAYWAAGGFSPF